MEPDSIAVVVVLFLAAAATLVVTVWVRMLLARLAAGLAVIVFAAAGGIAIVNDYYGYYQTWSQLRADLSGSYAAFAPARNAVRRTGTAASGRIVAVTLPGARSGITRRGLVYLPAQYFEPAYRHTDFPTVELVHGTPGSPTDWVVHMGLTAILDRLAARHLAGPMIIVMPTMSVGHHFEECVDGPQAMDETYVVDDVRHDVLAQFRASRDFAEWGIAGYSSGGYCAANLALRDRRAFGAAGVMDGYFRPADGPAAAALGDAPAAEAANDPLLLAGALGRDTRPLPSFWVSAGTGDRADIAAAHAFVAALHGVEQVTLYRQPGAAHDFYAWRPAVPRLLAWLWTQLAPPQLRVDFPIAGSVRTSILPTYVPPHAAGR